MKKLALLFSIIVLTFGTCLAQTSSFTYQGKLGDGGTPANGSYQFECKLYDGSGVVGDSGTQIGVTQTVVAQVQNGIFTMQLDFGAASFAAGQNRWLEIGVRLNGSNGAYTVFDPRQLINSVPFAVRSLNATTADNATKLAGVTAGNYVQTSDSRLSDARAPTSGSTGYIQNNIATQPASNFNVSGNGTVNGLLSGNVVNAATQYNIGGNGGSRILSNPGNQNLFAGVGAGQTNTGNLNSFFGKDAGLANAAGADNSFFGWSAGASNTSGSFNAFFGIASGLNNKTGSHNSFFGDSSGLNSTGDFNSFFGAESGFANTQGVENSFFGVDSGELNTTGNTNSSFGISAGQNNSSGNNNTFIGARSGNSNTSENNNTFIGNQANGAANITNATAIGNQAKVTQSNSLVLGSIDFNDGLNPPIIGTKVGIGTSAPARRLHVSGTGSDGVGQTDLRITGTGPIASGITLESTGAGGRTYSWLSTADNTGGGGFGPGRLAVFDVTAGAYRMVIDGTGNVGIGTFSPDQTLTVNGNASKVGGGSWLAFSDERLKNIKGRFTPGLKALMQLQPLRYVYKPDNALGLKSSGEQIGFGAQAVQKIIPEAVTKNESGYLLVNNDPIMWTMLNAIKEQQLHILKLERELASVKTRTVRHHRRSIVRR